MSMYSLFFLLTLMHGITCKTVQLRCKLFKSCIAVVIVSFDDFTLGYRLAQVF